MKYYNILQAVIYIVTGHNLLAYVQIQEHFLVKGSSVDLQTQVVVGLFLGKYSHLNLFQFSSEQSQNQIFA